MTTQQSTVVHGDTEVAAGTWFHNSVTGELGRINVSPADTAGRRLETEGWLQPGAAVVGAHVHRDLVERFEVLGGEVGFQVGGGERVVRRGDGMVEVGAGVVHDWWNAGDGVAHVRVVVEARADAPGRPASRFVSMVEALFSLSALGRVNSKGLPDPLWLAAIAREYRDVLRLVRPPAFVQAALFGPLAALARRTGRDPLSPELHSPDPPFAIPEPSEERFDELLARPVAARAARSRRPAARRRAQARARSS